MFKGIQGNLTDLTLLKGSEKQPRVRTGSFSGEAWGGGPGTELQRAVSFTNSRVLFFNHCMYYFGLILFNVLYKREHSSCPVAILQEKLKINKVNGLGRLTQHLRLRAQRSLETRGVECGD